MRRKFCVGVTLAIDVEVDDRVFKAVLNDEWRSHFYPLHTKADVIEHVLFNLVQGRSLRSLDGFANLPGESVSVGRTDWMDWDVTDAKGKALPR